MPANPTPPPASETAGQQSPGDSGAAIVQRFMIGGYMRSNLHMDWIIGDPEALAAAIDAARASDRREVEALKRLVEEAHGLLHPAGSITRHSPDCLVKQIGGRCDCGVAEWRGARDEWLAALDAALSPAAPAPAEATQPQTPGAQAACAPRSPGAEQSPAPPPSGPEWLDELERMEREATKAPWQHGFDDGTGRANAEGETGAWITAPEACRNVATGGRDSWGVELGIKVAADADFVVALRNRFPDLLRLARRGAEAEDTLAKLPRTRDGTPSRLNPDDIKLSVEEVTNMLRQAEHADPSLRKFFDDIGHTALLRDWLRLRARGAEVPRGNGGED